MKILFNCALPFSLTHGGQQIQVEQTMIALEKTGIQIEPFRWWDAGQKGDIIHHFGRIPSSYIELAHRKGIKVIICDLFSEPCNRSNSRLVTQGILVGTALRVPFARGIKNQLGWSSYRSADHNVVGLEAECEVLQTVYNVSPDKISVVPLGLSETYRRAGPGPKNQSHLIYTGTITKQKNCLELAELARAAKVSILFVGKPYSFEDPYWLRFQKLIDGQFVKHHPHVETEEEMVRLLQCARGFVLMSSFENWSLSTQEAVACGLPILVQQQKWSRERFGNQARYFETIGFSRRNVEILRKFWEDAPALPAPNIKLSSWNDVAQHLGSIYKNVLDCRA